MDSNSYDLYTDLIAEVSMSKTSFVAMGKLLLGLREDDNYLNATGEGVETWGAFLAQPEIGMSVSEANRLIQIYEQFVLRYGYNEATIASIPIKNLYSLLPIVKEMGGENSTDMATVSDLIDAAGSLSQRDFRERIREYKDDDGIRTYTYMVMKRCNETGNMRKVHDVESEAIKSTFNLKD